MRVGKNLLSHRFGSLFPAPHLRPAQEEPLLGREAVDVCRARFALHRLLKREPRDLQTAEVSDRLTQNELAILVHADLFRPEAGKLLLYTSGALGVILGVYFGPPVFQVSLQIKLAGLI